MARKLLALCLSLLCCPAAFAAVDSSSCQTVPYAQATSQPLGQPITITGTPNYSAATSNDTAFIFGFDLKACRGFPVSGADDKDDFDAKSKQSRRERRYAEL